MRNLIAATLLACAPAVALAQTAPSKPPMPYQPPLMHYIVKVVHEGKVETEFTMDMRSDRPGVMANQRSHGYIVGCTQTLNATDKSTNTGLIPGTATEGLTVQGSVDPDTGNHAVFDVTIVSLQSMRRIKQGDCEVEVPNMSTVHQTIAVDVPVGEAVSATLAGTNYALIVTHTNAL